MRKKNNIIKNNYIFYQSQVLNDKLNYILCLGGDKKLDITFSKYEFLHLTGLGQYLSEIHKEGQKEKPANIITNIKNEKYILEDFDETICKKHYIYEKMENFQSLITALDNDFDIYKYKKNRAFPNEEAKYVIISNILSNDNKDTNILLFVDMDKNMNYYIRSFVANPDERKISQLATELKSLKMLYKEKNILGIPPQVLYSITPNFTKELFQEKLTPQELKQKQQTKKQNNVYQEKNSKIKEKMRNDELSKLDRVKEELISMDHTVFNDMLNDEIIIDQKIKIPVNTLDIVSIQNAIKTLKDIVNKEREKSQKLINNELEIQDIPELA